MIHVSLDLETLGRTPNAVITEVGAVSFDPDCGLFHGRFHRIVSVASQMGFRSIEPATLKWWMQQEHRENVIHALGLDDLESPLHEVLTRFARWIEKEYGPRGVDTDDQAEGWLWANHPEFDVAMLIDAYRDTMEWGDQEVPWGYRAPVDLRSFFRGAQVDKKELEAMGPSREELKLMEHCAVDDAMWQAHLIIRAHELRRQRSIV